jgi:hypothetical protein
LQAVTRVKLEQASKVKMWTPTRLRNGEGSTGREESGAGTRKLATNEHLIRSTGVVSTACREGDLGQWGRLGAGGDRVPERRQKGRRPVRESERVVRPMRPGNAGGGKGPYFWWVCEGGKER